jgi:hypothetical protein
MGLILLFSEQTLKSAHNASMFCIIMKKEE